MPLGLNSTDAGPGYDGEAVDVSAADHEVTAECTRKIFVGGAGDLEFDTLGGTKLVVAMAADTWHDLMVTKIYNANTTATQIAVFW